MKEIAYSSIMNGQLDDDYTLYDNGEVLHEYDRHTYPGGFNLKEKIQASELSIEIKQRLIDAASPDNKELVKKILGHS